MRKLLLLGILFAATLHQAKATQPPAPAPPSRVIVDSISVTVSDMSRALDFYTHVLPFRKVADREVSGDDYEHLFGVFGIRVRCVRLKLGQEHLELMQFLAPQGSADSGPLRSNDRWFQHISIIVSDMQAAYTRLRDFKVEYASSGPQRLPDSNPNAGGIQAFYFHDPDGHNLEILAFPPDKGDPRWHAKDSLFLGIDHSAIVVSNTEASLRFYRKRLGMRVAETSDNFGTEQEHLNNVFGAHLRITTLRPADGPGVEFLEYLSPTTGRPMPPDTQANDLWYWQVNLRLNPPAQPIPLHDTALGWSAALILHDPDGHASLLGRSVGESK